MLVHTTQKTEEKRIKVTDQQRATAKKVNQCPAKVQYPRYLKSKKESPNKRLVCGTPTSINTCERFTLMACMRTAILRTKKVVGDVRLRERGGLMAGMLGRVAYEPTMVQAYSLVHRPQVQQKERSWCLTQLAKHRCGLLSYAEQT